MDHRLLLMLASAALQLLLLLTIVICLYKYKWLSKSFKLFTFYLIANLLFEFTSFILAKNNIPNLRVIQFYTIVEFIFLSEFFRYFILNPPFLKKHLLRINLVFTFLLLFDFLFLQSDRGFNSYSDTVENVFLIILSSLVFYNVFSFDNIEKPQRKPLILVNYGVLIYLSGTLLIFLFNDYILKSFADSLTYLWIFNIPLNFIFKLFLFLGALYYPVQKLNNTAVEQTT